MAPHPTSGRLFTFLGWKEELISASLPSSLKHACPASKDTLLSAMYDLAPQCLPCPRCNGQKIMLLTYLWSEEGELYTYSQALLDSGVRGSLKQAYYAHVSHAQ